MKRAPFIAVLILVTACSNSGSSLKVTGTVTATGAPLAQTARLQMNDNLQFVPNVVEAKVGHLTLDVENSGRVPHNLTFDDRALGATDTVRGHATATLSLTLTTPGTYRFVCTIHSGMDGKVVVTR